MIHKYNILIYILCMCVCASITAILCGVALTANEHFWQGLRTKQVAQCCLVSVVCTNTSTYIHIYFCPLMYVCMYVRTYLLTCGAWARLLWRPGEFKTSEWIKVECVSLGTKYLFSRDLHTCKQKKVFLVSNFFLLLLLLQFQPREFQLLQQCENLGNKNKNRKIHSFIVGANSGGILRFPL